MSHTEKYSLTRRELLKTAGKATAVVVASPLVELAFGGDGVLSAQALPPAAFNAAAGPDRGEADGPRSWIPPEAPSYPSRDG
jgi:hypothetical protein